MKPKDVNSVLGDEDRKGKNGVGNIVEFRDVYMMTCIYENSELVEVGFSEINDLVFFDGCDLIKSPCNEVIKFLYSHDQLVFQGFGSIVFMELGISLTGYYPEDDEIRAVTAFRKNRWANIVGEMVPFTIDTIM